MAISSSRGATTRICATIIGAALFGAAGVASGQDAEPEVVGDPSDDAIPTDLEEDPSGAEWEVVEYEDDGDDEEDEYWDPYADDDESGIREPGDIPTVRQPASSASDDDGNQDVEKSAGGRPVPDKGVPWQAQIYGPGPAELYPEKSRAGKQLWQLQHYCGGTLIAPNWVLTAAHCIDQEMVRAGYRVRLGAEDISKDNGWTYKIERIVRHSSYKTRYAHDIALIHIVADGPQRPLDPTQVRPIALHKGPIPRNGEEVTATGWGKTEPVEGNAPAAVLMKVDLQTLTTQGCQSVPDYGQEKVHDQVICAANPRRSVCQGDSGGPLIFTNGLPTLVGIVSWGKKRCTGGGQPGVFTRVASYIGWIEQAMRLDPRRNSLP